jgi:hypothetical protein
MAAPLSVSTTHDEWENDPWTIQLPDHPDRSDSAGFLASKALAKQILAALGVSHEFYGSDSLQMHHGGSLWLFDGDEWFMVQNEAGIEWSAQFCADPAKVEQLRQNAVRLYARFPETVPEMERLGYGNAQSILTTPITDATTVATWVDSIYNSCVPLPATRHVGVQPTGGGRHHYPTPITDIDLVKADDFVLWVTDPASQTPAAVVPVAPRGAGVDQVQLAYATPGTALAAQHEQAQVAGTTVTFDASSPLTTQAYARQSSAAPK